MKVKKTRRENDILPHPKGWGILKKMENKKLTKEEEKIFRELELKGELFYLKNGGHISPPKPEGRGIRNGKFI